MDQIMTTVAGNTIQSCQPTHAMIVRIVNKEAIMTPTLARLRPYLFFHHLLRTVYQTTNPHHTAVATTSDHFRTSKAIMPSVQTSSLQGDSRAGFACAP